VRHAGVASAPDRRSRGWSSSWSRRSSCCANPAARLLAGLVLWFGIASVEVMSSPYAASSRFHDHREASIVDILLIVPPDAWRSEREIFRYVVLPPPAKHHHGLRVGSLNAVRDRGGGIIAADSASAI